MGLSDKVLSFMEKLLTERIRKRAAEMVDEDWKEVSDFLLTKGQEFKEKASDVEDHHFPFTSPAAGNIGWLRGYVLDGRTPPGYDDKTDGQAAAIVTYGDWYLQRATREIMVACRLIVESEGEQK